MTPQPTYTTQKLTIPALGTASVSRAATFLICLAATHRFKLRFEHGHETDFEAGLKFRQEVDFTRIEIINPSSTDALTVELGFGRGDIDDARLVLSGVIGTTVTGGQVTAKARTPETLKGPTFPNPIVIAANSTALLVAQNANRHRIHMTVQDSPLWVQVTSADLGGVANNGGLPVKGGDRLTLETTSQIYIVNNNASPMSVWPLEEVWSV
jgi:hypothetical protein